MSETLVIADATGPVGLAGVMGGEKSGIAVDTADVFLEGAYFPPDTVAGVARRHGLATDAAQRFERGVDPRGQERAIERATELLVAIAGGRAGPCRPDAGRGGAAQAARRDAAAGAGREPPGRADPARRDRGHPATPRHAGGRRRRHPRRHPAEPPFRHRDRAGPDRGSRAHPRLRQHPAQRREDAAASAARDGTGRHAGAPAPAAGRPRLSGSHHLQLRGPAACSA